MDFQDFKSSRLFRKRYPVILTLALSTVVLYIAISFLGAPFRACKEFENAGSSLSSESLFGSSGRTDGLLEERKQVAFLNARIGMSALDSVGLVLDLADSTLSLEIYGIQLYQARILRYKRSRIFSKVQSEALISVFSIPLSGAILGPASPKYVRVVTKIGNDTTSGNAPINYPDTCPIFPVRVKYLLDAGIVLSVSGEHEKRSVQESILKRVPAVAAGFQSFIRKGTFNYDPWIDVVVDDTSAMTVLRALPDKPNVVIKI